jgi:hypothetical protein
MVDYSKKEIVWICGKPCAGKTFCGDYLQTKGWHHVDGDGGNQSPDPEVRTKMFAMFEGIQAISKGKEVPKDCWKGYYGWLID